ncbi:MAG: hypothetical protein ACI8RZ_001584 [Myxococcota bacterium]|jgi:hypothetical protein
MLLALTLMGCDPDCGDTSRMDGDYVVWSHSAVTDDLVTGTNTADYPFRQIFVNGWSEWTIKYIPSKQSFQLSVDGQAYEGTYEPDPNNCNNFSLVFQGTYSTEADTAHSFLWQGDLSYLGVHIAGTFTYKDNWTDLATGVQGSLEIPAGELTATLRSEVSEGGATDTGG